jgi:hypothetical protein
MYNSGSPYLTRVLKHHYYFNQQNLILINCLKKQELFTNYS